MIVYADRKRLVRTSIATGSWREAVIEFGEIEAAVADAHCPEVDQPDPLLDQLRSLAVRLAGGDMEALKHLRVLPSHMWVSVPEGYAYYGVYPEDYGKAAERFFREVRPEKVVVIGIRSIGTSLSAVVAASLKACGCDVRPVTVRPRGHPFDRQLRIQNYEFDLSSHFLVVDEGPGISGSSFGCVTSYLSSAGVPDSRITLFPSWEPDGEHFLSAKARSEWRRYRKYTECRRAFPGFTDLSGGQWREWSVVDPPVQPQHERRKYLRDNCLYKFEGLEHYGRRKLQRARILAEAGFIPWPIELQDGYLACEWIGGKPVTGAEESFAAWTCRYLRFLASTFPSDRPIPFDENLQMIRTNVQEGLGSEWAKHIDFLERQRAAICDRATVEIDGRLLPYEFLCTASGFVKTDALDHHDDHFFPGCQDIGWDVASLLVEFGLEPLPQTLPAYCLRFYVIAYLSYRIGYCTMAGQSGPDAHRFCTLANRYKEKLRRELNRLR